MRFQGVARKMVVGVLRYCFVPLNRAPARSVSSDAAVTIHRSVRSIEQAEIETRRASTLYVLEQPPYRPDIAA
jgi:hypothetical protein